jgi:diadenosine tetraphosphate (Ap4A) HIT family hydrolase
MSDCNLPVVLETPTFRVAPCLDCDVPGYIVVEPRITGNLISELPDLAKQELGPLLGRLETAVLETTGAEHVYVLRFSEGLGTVHFHIFPRTKELGSLWSQLSADHSKEGINGPLLFSWARIKYHVDHPDQLSSVTLATAREISCRLKSAGESG